MLAKNYPVDEISELTGLPVETLKEPGINYFLLRISSCTDTDS